MADTPLPIDHIRDHIENNEGRRAKAYPDPVKPSLITVGIGHNLMADPARDRGEFKSLGLDYEKVVSGQQQLSDKQIDALFHLDLNRALDNARDAISNFDQLPGDKKIAVTDMAFILDPSTFPRFCAAVEKQDWQSAADEMRDSTWWRNQARNRAERDAKIMEEDPTSGS